MIASRWGWYALAGLTVLCPVLAFGQPSKTAPPLDLPAVLRAVARENPTLQAARLKAEALGTRGRQVSALPDPSFYLTVLPFPVFTARGAQRSQWRLEQDVPFPGKRSLRGKIADLKAEAARYDADALTEDLLLDARLTYYELFGLQEQLRLIGAFRQELDGFAEAAAARYATGQGLQQAVLKAQLEKNTLARRQIALETARQAALERLARLMNLATLDGPAAAPLAPPPPPALPDTALYAALERLPEVRALRTTVERAGRRIDLAGKASLPDFSFNLTYFDIYDSGIPAAADGRNALALGIGVKIPLWQGRLRAGREEAMLDRLRLEARYEALTTRIRRTVSEQRSRLRLERQTLDLYATTLIPQAETTREATLSAYTTGRTGFLDLLDAERMLFSLRFDAEAARVRLRQAAARLERALGVPALSEIESSTRR